MRYVFGGRRHGRGTVMSEFAYLFRGGVRASSPEGWQEQMQKWVVWMKDLGAKGHIKDPGSPLEPSGKIVKGTGGKSMAEGPHAESKDVVVGYMIVTARDLTHAVELASGCPIFETGGLVEVRPLTKMG
jgi:hypothetical protein